MTLNFSLSDEQIKLQQEAREKFRAISEKHQSLRANERQNAAFEEVWAVLADIGLLGFFTPEKYGGSKRGLLASVLVMEELAAQSLHSFMPILNCMGSICIARFGTETLKQSILPKIVKGKLKLAIASTEADAGFNVLNVKTFAENRGDHFIVSGSKIYISGIDIADYALLVTRTISIEECKKRGLPKTTGITLLLLDTKTKGLEYTRVPSRGEGVMSQFSLELKNVLIPADQLIGEEHEGTKVMFQAFNPERTLVSAMALGICRYCLELACEYAQTRSVFKNIPIGAYQSIQHPLAELSIQEKAVRLMTYRSALFFDRSSGGSDLAESANSAKYLAAELAIKAVDTAIDTFGGKGFDEDYGIIHLLEAARLLKTAPISNALILNQIAEHHLHLPRSY